MKSSTDTRYHDLCPEMEMEKLFAQVRGHDTRQTQLTFGKSISDYDFTTGHYSSGFTRATARELEGDQIRVVVLGYYINSVNPTEPIHQAGVARFVEYMEYIRVIGAGMVRTETGRLDPDFRVTEKSYTEDAYQLLLRSMREIVAAAEELGVTVGVEGVFNHTLHSPARMKRFLEDVNSPNIEAILNVMNLVHPEQAEPETQKGVIDKAFTYYSSRIGALHVKNSVSDGQEQLFRHTDDGLFQYESLMKRIKERKPHIAMSLGNSSREQYHKDVKFLQTIYGQMQIWNTPELIKRLRGVF